MERAKIILNSLRRNADLLVFAVVLQFWQFLTGTPANLRTVLTVAGLYLVFRFSSAGREVEQSLSAVPAEKEKREFVEDPEAVLEITKRTGYDRIRQMAPYLGKWMTISGKYEGIAESLQRDAVHLSLLLNDGRRINLRFAVEHWDRLRAIQEGQRITATCQIPRYGLIFSPENCELIRVEPLRIAERSRLAYAS